MYIVVMIIIMIFDNKKLVNCCGSWNTYDVRQAKEKITVFIERWPNKHTLEIASSKEQLINSS